MIDDPVTHPRQYTQGKVQMIRALESMLTPGEFRGYLRGQVIKYIWRCELKGNPRQDCMKAHWYLQRLLDHYESQPCEDRND